MQKSTINKVLLARRLYQLSQENLNSDNAISLSVGINLLQDSVETFLLAVSEQVVANVGSNTNFDKYFDLINKKIEPNELPFRFRLNSLNKLRVNSKHYGLSPSKEETEGFLLTVKEFFEEVSLKIFKKIFSSITLIDLIGEGEKKELLREAEESFLNKDYQECLINCRKAIFVEIERHYNICPYDQEKKPEGLAVYFMGGYKAPYYARNKKYIEENVKSPTDYVVYDHNQLDMDLMKAGMSRIEYWNVWRLTPQVFRKDNKSEWMIKYELDKLDGDGIQERAEYVLDATINLLITKHLDLTRSKTPNSKNFYINLKRDDVPIFTKADKESKQVTTVPHGIRKIYVDYSVPGLTGAGEFWHVSHYEDNIHLYGFIDKEEVMQ